MTAPFDSRINQWHNYTWLIAYDQEFGKENMLVKHSQEVAFI
jgi:hypothetical protein